jgi:hypothetical protein
MSAARRALAALFLVAILPILVLAPTIALAQASLPSDSIDLTAYVVARFHDGSAGLAIAGILVILGKVLDALLLKPGAALADKVSRDVLRYFAIAGGVLAGIAGALLDSQPWYVAIGKGLLAGLGAVGLDQALKAPKPVGTV